MNEIDAIILGVIQGLTEFLPVSSVATLKLQENYYTNQLPSDNLLMTSVLHFATALSTILVFRKDIYDLIKGLFDKENKTSKSYVIKILIAIVPAGLVGFLLSDEIEFLFSGNMTLVGIMLIITGTLLFLTKILKPKILKYLKFMHLLLDYLKHLLLFLEFQDLEPQFAPHFFRK